MGRGLGQTLVGITSLRQRTVGQVLHPSMNDTTAHHVKLGAGRCPNVEWAAK